MDTFIWVTDYGYNPPRKILLNLSKIAAIEQSGADRYFVRFPSPNSGVSVNTDDFNRIKALIKIV